MKGIDRLAVIRHKSKINKDWKHSDLFRILRKNDIWIVAYENIKNNKGALTKGIPKETLYGISNQSLVRLQDKVINESYQFKPVNEIKIPKLNGQKKLLGLPTINDKIVQEVIRMVLEAIYEPCFSKQSFGFCHVLDTHDTLDYIESEFRNVNWVIKEDREGTDLTIDPKELCNILSKKIQDVRFMNLIRKLLKCGVLCKGIFTRSNFGVPQRSIVSPIFVSIYFSELDEWVENKANMLYQTLINQLSYQILEKEKQIQKLEKKSNEYKILLKELKILKKERSSTKQKIQIKYVRYAYDWMIGIKGDQTLAKELKLEVSNFVMSILKQRVHPTKIKIINLRSGKVKFLGYDLYLPRNRYTGFVPRTKWKTQPRLRFDIPIDSILQKMKERGYIKKLVKGYRPISKANYTSLEDIAIVKHFAQVWRRLSNYYSGCTNLSKLQYIHNLLHLSCAMTLSHRHRSSTKKIFIKHGKTLKVSNGKISISFPYRNEWSIKNRKWQKNKKFIDPF